MHAQFGIPLGRRRVGEYHPRGLLPRRAAARCEGQSHRRHHSRQGRRRDGVMMIITHMQPTERDRRRTFTCTAWPWLSKPGTALAGRAATARELEGFPACRADAGRSEGE